MAKIPGNKDKASFEDWMVRISFAEVDESDEGFKLTGIDRARKLALDKILVTKSEGTADHGEQPEGAETMPADAQRSSSPDDGKVRVMIVDDEPIVGKRLRPTLTKHGFEVEVFEDPAQALKRLNEQSFDIVVTDLRMDEVDGIQMLEHVMSSCPDTRVILITGYATVEVAREALVKGAFDFIAKPFKPRDLRAVINKAALSLGFSGAE
jgi:CheY-like chemotaxis protein